MFALTSTILWLKLLTVDAAAYEFEVHGTMEYAPMGFPAVNCSFHIYVKNCSWAIYEVFDHPGYRIINETSEDGENIYRLDHITTNVTTHFEPTDYAGLNPMSLSGEIHPSGFPFRILDSETIALFYVYASGCYLDKATNQIIGSIMFSPNDLGKEDAQSLASIDRGTSVPRLPVQLVFFGDDTNQITAVLKTTAYTNLDGMHLPLSMTLLRFFHHQTKVLSTYNFQVGTISDVCTLSNFSAPFPGRAVVSDYRLAHQRPLVPPVVQLLTNGFGRTKQK
jgi:hypothetical protein